MTSLLPGGGTCSLRPGQLQKTALGENSDYWTVECSSRGLQENGTPDGQRKPKTSQGVSQTDQSTEMEQYLVAGPGTRLTLVGFLTENKQATGGAGWTGGRSMSMNWYPDGQKAKVTSYLPGPCILHTTA